MYKDEIAEFLKSKTVRQVSIPDHDLITALETRLGKKEWERCCLLLNQIFRQHRHSIKFEREICGLTIAPYEVTIFHTVKIQLCGNTYADLIMQALLDTGIITMNRKHWFNIQSGVYKPAVYGVNKDVWQAKEKQVTLSTQNAINAWTQWLIQRQRPFTRADRDVINRQHKYLHYDITGAEYALQSRREALAEAKAKAVEDGKTFDRSAWRRGYIYQCRQIDSWNQIPDREKWILCRVDPFGNRLHHGLTNCPSGLRQHSRIGELMPLFEIDLVSSQPTLTAINMQAAGVTDAAFFADINDGQLYERYAQKRGLGWSRARAKTMMFTALFGSADSSELKNLACVYPTLAQYLRKVKSEIRPEEAKTVTDYTPSKNNCIDVQRAESAWAREVWKDLTKAGIRFLPIHDSILVYGYESMFWFTVNWTSALFC